MAHSSSICSDDLEKLQTLKENLQKKMAENRSDFSLKPIRTKPEKLTLQGLSRDLSVNRTSSGYFPGSPVGVPFGWESQPGTPKIVHGERLIPPLTPPPSFTASPARKHVKKQPKSANLLKNVLPRRLIFVKSSQTRSNPPPVFDPHTLSYKLSPTLYSVPSSPFKSNSRPESRQSSSTSSSESRPDSDDYELPSSIFCFGRR